MNIVLKKANFSSVKIDTVKNVTTAKSNNKIATIGNGFANGDVLVYKITLDSILVSDVKFYWGASGYFSTNITILAGGLVLLGEMTLTKVTDTSTNVTVESSISASFTVECYKK